MFEGAAALLVHLRRVVGLFRLLLALEGGEGDFQGLAQLARRRHVEAYAEQQRDMQDRRDEQGETQPVRRANAGGHGEGGVGCSVHRGSCWPGRAKSADGTGKCL
ncbi:hypothetical protein D3C80_1901120 [compost metagenome]